MQYTPANKRLFVLWCLFLILAITGVLHHEIWLDEAHHWLLARDSDSLRELWQNMRYDGHPMLWNSVLYLITRVTSEPSYMQLTHVLIASASVAILLFQLPLTLYQKTLTILSYYILYEYTLISRNYALLLLLLFAAVALLQSTPQKVVRISLVLALLANTHLFGLILSCSLVAIMALNAKSLSGVSKRDFIIAGGVFLVGSLFSVLQSLPPPDAAYLSAHSLKITVPELMRALSTPLKGLLPIPDFWDYHFWNSHLIIRLSKPIAGILSVLLFLTPAFLFRKRESLAFFYTNALLIIIFLSVTGLAAARYSGIMFILFVTSLSIERSSFGSPLFSRSLAKPVLSNIIVYFILVVQALIGIYSYWMDLKRPFSEGKNVVNYLRNNNLDNRLILGEFCESTTLSTYLQKKVYYLELKDYGSFCRWNWNDTFLHDENFLMEEAIRISEEFKEKRPLFIHYKPLSEENRYRANFRLRASFTNSMIRNENFYIYEVTPEPSP